VPVLATGRAKKKKEGGAYYCNKKQRRRREPTMILAHTKQEGEEKGKGLRPSSLFSLITTPKMIARNRKERWRHVVLHPQLMSEGLY